LKRVGIRVEETFRDFSNTAASEIIRQSQLDRTGKLRTARSMECIYAFVHRPEEGQVDLEEIRGNREGQPLNPGKTEGGFMVTSGFVASLMILHPEFQARASYRFLGAQPLASQLTYVIGFAQSPEKSRPMGSFTLSQGRITPLYLQGIDWVSADHQVLRLRTDLLHPVPKISLTRDTSEVDFRPYHFMSSHTTLLLPYRVTVSVEWGRKRLRNEHIFSKFRLFNVDVHQVSASGGPTLNAAHPEFRLNPSNDNVHVNLGFELDNKGNLDAAIAEYREGLRLNPENDSAHYNLGIALGAEGTLGGAIAETRTAVQLKPNDALLHYSLAFWLEKQGDDQAALGEYRTAFALNPENSQFKRAYERLVQKTKSRRASGPSTRKPAEGT